jgi:hypothetical protein
LGYIIGFSTIFLILSSNIIISHQNFSIAYPYVNEVFDELNRYAIIAVQDTERNFETSASISNPSFDDWKKKLCENGIQADNNIGTPLICNPSEKTDDKSTDDQQNTETSDKINKKMEKLNEKLEKSLSNNGINVKSHLEDSPSETKNIDDNRGNTERNNDNNENNDIEDNDVNKDKDNQLLEQQQSSEDQEESKAEGGENYDSNNDDNRGNTERNNDKNENNDNEDNVGIAGLDLNIDKKLTDADKKIENLKDKVNKENNNLLFDQVEENIAKEKNNKAKENDNKDQDNNEQNLGITGLDSKIQKIQTNLEKQIEKLKDKFENERDNQRLIEQRNEFDDDDDDDGDSKDDDDNDGKNYDGYGFNGDNDDGKENAEENFNFATAGDFGCSTNTKNTVENMQSKEPEIVLALGDLSYHSTADCWFDMMSPIKDKLMITLGHHDVEDGQAKMDQYLNSFGLEKPFYSYEYNKVHFLVMSAKSVYNEGSEQYNFILEDLKKASENKDVNWIVVSSYGPPYTSPSEHTAFKELRDVYHPIFEKYGVDLVLSGHNHNYQRTHPITYNPNESSEPVVTNDRSAEYNSQKDGIVFAIVGTGGVNFYSFDGQAPFVDTQFANKFGFLNIDISNGNPHTKLTGTFYDNKGDQILDQFTIDKEIANKNSEVISN